MTEDEFGIPSSGRRADLIDVGRLDREELEVWDEFWPGPIGPTKSGAAVELWSVGYWFMLELGRVPDAIEERRRKLDPDNLVLQYVENVRRARGVGPS